MASTPGLDVTITARQRTTPQPAFFDAGRSYLYDGPHGKVTRFQVAYVAPAPVGFERPDDTGPVAFGWYQRLADGKTVPLGSFVTTDFAGWTLEPAEPDLAPQLAFRAEFDSMTLGTYTTRAAAEQHCATDLHNNVDVEGQTLGWVPEDDSDTAVSELSLFGPGPNQEDTTGYTVTPIELHTAYDPNADS